MIVILEAEILILKARQAAVREWTFNKDLQLEVRVLDRNIHYLNITIEALKDSLEKE